MGSDQSQKSGRVDSVNLLVFLFKHRMPIIVICTIAVIGAIIASFIIEEKYRSSVVLFPTSTNSFGKILMEETNKDDLLEFGEKEEGERLLQIINSDEIRGRIINKYELFRHYDITADEPGANTLMQKEYESNISAKMTRFGSVKIDVLDRSPDTAMYIANDIANLVDTVNNRLKNERALDAFRYAESEYLNLLDEIKQLEDSMGSLRNLGIYDYITQIEGLNEQYATALAKGQPRFAQELKQQMEEISKYGSIYTKLETLIESAYEREAILKTRFDLLKIDVNSKLPSKFVVNQAQKADKKAYPVRWLIVVMTAVSAFVFSLMLLLILDNLKSLRSQGRI